MKSIKLRSLLYLFPYIILLMLGAWYRVHTSNVVFFDGNTDSYTLPPYLKAVTGNWYLGDRPFQYLHFIYLFLSRHDGLFYVVIAQKILGLTGAAFLTGAWIAYVVRSKSNVLLSHLLGYIMLGIYISSPVLMYYEQLIGPESVCMFVMCVLICCLSIGFDSDLKPGITAAFLSAAIFVNLYLAEPMPKYMFASIALEVILIAVLMLFSEIPLRKRLLLLLFPHLLYLFIAVIPARIHKTEKPFQNLLSYIEYQQMVYTHFDLLVQDRSNFETATPLYDSLLVCFHESQVDQANTLTGSSNDYLMFGRASESINEYYHYHYDSIGRFYKHLCYVLVTRYPLGLAKEIGRQIYAFYIPNRIIRKDLFSYYVGYADLKSQLKRSDDHLMESLNNLKVYTVDPEFLLVPRYQSPETVHGVLRYEELPLLFDNGFFFYRWFDVIFIVTMLLFFVVRAMKRELLQADTVSILYLIIFVYVLTVSIVHTFDVNRFISTIYPFILVTTFMAIIYIVQSIYSVLSGSDKNT